MSKTRQHALNLCGLAALFLFATAAGGGTYMDSGHGGYNTANKGVKRLTGYVTGNCAHCHEQHASVGGSEPAPAGGAPSPYGLFDTTSGNTLCVYCHNSTYTNANGAPAIASQIDGSKTYFHNPAAGTVLCTDCHNTHVAQPGAHSPAADGNAVSGPLLAISGKGVSNWAVPSSPAGSEVLSNATLAPKDPVTAEYELCFKCHDGTVGTLANITGQFNPNNYAHHPVTGTGQWKNTTIRTNYTTLLKAPWNANLDARMYCSDCHGSETTGDPAGPHGSNNPYILKAVGPGSSYDNLCLSCHADAYNGTGVSASPFPHNSTSSAHQYQGENAGQNKLGCLACHGGPDLADYTKVSGVSSNGGRIGAVHGENFNWTNPDTSTSPADRFLLGGYLLGVNTTSRTCWAGMSGTDGCHLTQSSYTW